MAEHHFQPEGTECIPNVLLMALHLTHVTKRVEGAILYRPLSNYAHGDLGTVRAMLADPNTLIGLGDGGHICRFCATPLP